MNNNHYRNTHYGAPQNTNAAGSNIAILDACLLNGYGSQVVTITRSGSTATAVAPLAHGLDIGLPIRMLIANADQPEYNGVVDVIPTTSNAYTYTVSGTPVSPATGTITAKVAPIGGWTKVFSATNKAVYKAAGTFGRCLWVDDTATTSTRIVGAENMPDINTFVGKFPTDAQVSGGFYSMKSDTGGAGRSWFLAASDRLIHSFVAHTNTAETSRVPTVFGTITQEDPNDAYACIINAASAIAGNLADYSTFVTNHLSANANCYVPRSMSGLGSSTGFGKMCISVTNQSGMGSTNGFNYPHPKDGKLHYAPVLVVDATGGLGVRGVLTGAWNPLHNRPLATLDSFQGVGADANRFFVAVNTYNSNQVLIEVSDTWGT